MLNLQKIKTSLILPTGSTVHALSTIVYYDLYGSVQKKGWEGWKCTVSSTTIFSKNSNKISVVQNN